ncbi:MAG: radical SAM protein [Clostridia bacterium]|nr:radical SAM protein [Clostridia bacterium]
MNEGCFLCPRECGADRVSKMGYCNAPRDIILARAALHFFEEPIISGKRGSGTVFFCGCNLGCVFCQNGAISRNFRNQRNASEPVSEEKLAKIILNLRDEGAHNINLVTPTHYSDAIARVLTKIKSELGIPVIYNCGGYEKVESLRALRGLVDIYMPDFKYFSPEISEKYSFAPDYVDVASEALHEMYGQVGEAMIGDDGMMKKGILLRHLVLPGGRHDSEKVLERIAKTVPPEKIIISIMSQYTPDFAPESMKELRRRITSFEYEYVLSVSEKLGFDGFSQERGSSNSSYTPDFSQKTF